MKMETSMKKNVSLLCFITLAFIQCAKTPTEPLEALNLIRALYQEEKFSEASEHFTRGTRRALDRLEDSHPGAREAGYGFSMLFMSGATWTVTDSTGNKDRAVIKVKYTAHPVENLRGNETEFIMIREGNAWKWDMESQVEEALKGGGSGSGESR